MHPAAPAAHPEGSIHLHIAEQLAEVEEVERAWGARPMAWLLDNHPVDGRWCLVHATHIDDAECAALARSGATAGLCPVTEADLGDGVFPGAAFVAAGAGRPLRALRLEGRACGDLTSLTRSATSRALRPWPPSAPAPPRLERGALMLGGM